METIVNKKVLWIKFLLVFLSSYSCSEVALGIGWPYLCGKYGFSKKISLEAKIASLENINVLSIRGAWNFYSYKNIRSFFAAEIGYVTFDSLGLKGDGFECGVPIGGEYFITKNLSLSCDLSPTYIMLASENTKVSSFEFVVNLAVYWYFSKR